MALISIDFDQTIVNNLSKSDGYYPDLYPGVRESINKLREKGHKVMIFSCNNPSWIAKCLKYYELKVDYIWEGGKPVADCYVDDRGVRFKGDWKESLEEVLEICRDTQ